MKPDFYIGEEVVSVDYLGGLPPGTIYEIVAIRQQMTGTWFVDVKPCPFGMNGFYPRRFRKITMEEIDALEQTDKQ